MAHRILLPLLLALSLTAPAQRVDPNRNSHFRIRCIDKMVTGADGVRRPGRESETRLGGGGAGKRGAGRVRRQGLGGS